MGERGHPPRDSAGGGIWPELRKFRSVAGLVSQGFSRRGVTNKSGREGPSSPGFSRGGYMATLMAGHRKMEESKQVGDDPST